MTVGLNLTADAGRASIAQVTHRNRTVLEIPYLTAQDTPASTIGSPAQFFLIGRNPAALGPAPTTFTGKNLTYAIPPAAKPESNQGPVSLILKFPDDRPGVSEPLLTTGKTGAGDFAYVTYADPHHIRLSLDHWGVGGKTSDLIPIDYTKAHEIVVSFSCLVPPANSPEW